MSVGRVRLSGRFEKDRRPSTWIALLVAPGWGVVRRGVMVEAMNTPALIERLRRDGR